MLEDSRCAVAFRKAIWNPTHHGLEGEPEVGWGVAVRKVASQHTAMSTSGEGGRRRRKLETLGLCH